MNKPTKWFTGLVCLLVLAIAGASFGAEEAKKDAAPKAKSAMHAGAKAVTWPAADLKWVHNPGSPEGVMMAVLWGDPEKGGHGAIHKFPAGFKAPLHTHSADLHAVVISGTIIHGDSAGKETRLGPGSYIFSPHTDKHSTACDAASECQMFVSANGKFDIKMVDEKMMEKKAAK